MTTLFLIRHAQAEGNLYRIAQGQFDSYITALGYKQIDALAERFKNVHLDALYSSDLRRTRTTATAITAITIWKCTPRRACGRSASACARA